ncbi:MAG: hypothetical protein U0326_34430 [Polyangiales bacterium]
MATTQSWWAARVAPMCGRCRDSSSTGYCEAVTSTRITLVELEAASPVGYR